MIPQKHPAYDEIIKRVESLQHFRAYEGLRKLIIETNRLKRYKHSEIYGIAVDGYRDKMNLI